MKTDAYLSHSPLLQFHISYAQLVLFLCTTLSNLHFPLPQIVDVRLINGANCFMAWLA